MAINKDILNELMEISPAVAALPRINVFTVAPDYFESIVEELKAKISADTFYHSDNAYSVPQGYFENLAGNIMSRIRAEENLSAVEEMETLSGTIAAIGNKNVFTVPAGYFENLSVTTETKEPAKVVQMNQRRSIFKYAAAAVITGLLGLSIINIGDKRPVAEDHGTVQMASTLETANNIVKNKSFDTELNSLSDEDLEAYLSGNGQNVNAAVIAASASDKPETLPDASDYILNENALEEYLTDNNLKN